MGFVKVDCGIVDSSLWIDRDHRSIFLTALFMAVPFELKVATPQIAVRTLDHTGWIVPPGWYGFIPAAGTGIIRRDGCDRETGFLALEALGSPDPDSRSQEFEGRRLVRINSGYIVLNYFKFRDRDYTAADRMRRLRARRKGEGVTRNVTQAEDRVQSTENNKDLERSSVRAPQHGDDEDDGSSRHSRNVTPNTPEKPSSSSSRAARAEDDERGPSVDEMNAMNARLDALPPPDAIAEFVSHHGLDAAGDGAVVSFLRSQKAPLMVIRTLRQHLHGRQPSKELATPDELVEAVTEYATEHGGVAFKVRLFNGYVRKVKQARAKLAQREVERTHAAELVIEQRARRASPESADAGFAAIRAATEGVATALDARRKRSTKPTNPIETDRAE